MGHARGGEPWRSKWLATFADPMRARSAIDRFTRNSNGLVIEGESFRSRLKPRSGSGQQEAAWAMFHSSRGEGSGGMVLKNRGPMVLKTDKWRSRWINPGGDEWVCRRGCWSREWSC